MFSKLKFTEVKNRKFQISFSTKKFKLLFYRKNSKKGGFYIVVNSRKEFVGKECKTTFNLLKMKQNNNVNRN